MYDRFTGNNSGLPTGMHRLRYWCSYFFLFSILLFAPKYENNTKNRKKKNKQTNKNKNNLPRHQWNPENETAQRVTSSDIHWKRIVLAGLLYDNSSRMSWERILLLRQVTLCNRRQPFTRKTTLRWAGSVTMNPSSARKALSAINFKYSNNLLVSFCNLTWSITR